MKLWIARDENGALFLYDKKPIKKNSRFDVNIFIHAYRISGHNFPEITFENSPQLVEVKLVKEE